jgi:branched-subunit amino acid ABC-type transport system permease component
VRGGERGCELRAPVEGVGALAGGIMGIVNVAHSAFIMLGPFFAWRALSGTYPPAPICSRRSSKAFTNRVCAIGAPSHEAGTMPEAIATDVVIPHLYNQFRLERLPYAAAISVLTRTSRGLPRVSRRGAHFLQLSR